MGVCSNCGLEGRKIVYLGGLKQWCKECFEAWKEEQFPQTEAWLRYEHDAGFVPTLTRYSELQQPLTFICDVAQWLKSECSFEMADDCGCTTCLLANTLTERFGE